MRSSPDSDSDATAPAEVKAAATDPKAEPPTSSSAVVPPAAPPPAPAAPSVPAASQVSDEGMSIPVVSNEKPAAPLTEIERRARSIANLEKIGKAWMAYTKNRKRLPPYANVQVSEYPLLSWRVLILRELGHPELYARFRTTEPWDGPDNKLLLDYIPPEYQSPERFDLKTNYLGLIGGGMALASEDGLRLDQLKDGRDNSLAIVEVDDMYAQEWTRPSDHQARLDVPFDRLGKLRGDGIFGILTSGRVVLVPNELPSPRLAALFTVAGGESVGPANFLKAPTVEPPPPTLAASIASAPEAASTVSQTPERGALVPAPAAADPAETLRLLGGPESYVPDPAKDRIPDKESLAKARELLKELYGKEYANARTRESREQFVKKMLAESVNVDQNASDFHELLRIARDMAVDLGDALTALAACERLEQRFQIDPLPLRLKALDDLSKQAKGMASVDPALKEARRLVREARDRDRYDVAIPAQELVLRFSRLDPGESKSDLVRIQTQVDSIQAAKTLYTAAEQALETLKANPNDSAANESVGKYLCLVKDSWEAGLPFMAQAADIRLRGIASLELAMDRSLAQTVSLADQHWDLASRFKQPLRRGLQLRAIYCYESVGESLASSLEKVRIERRIDEAVEQYGQEEIDRIVAPLRKTRARKPSQD